MTKQEFTTKYTNFLNKHGRAVVLAVMILTTIGGVFCKPLAVVCCTYAVMNNVFYFTWYKKYFKKG